ncbi:MAG: CHASE2 domain-containing protein, partial [Arenicellales bacterium]
MTGHRIPVRTLTWGNALVFLVVFGLITAFPRALEFFELKTVDSRFQIRDALGMNPEYSNALVHINLDNYSKQASGVSFWPKTHYADLIQRIAEGNAEAIACDVMFVEWA